MSKYNRDQNRYITNRALELRTTNNYSEAEIAQVISEELGQLVSRNTVHGRLYRSLNHSGLELKPRPKMVYFEKYEKFFSNELLPRPKTHYDLSSGPLKILVLNDLHTPFQHEAALEQAITTNRSADVVITSEVSDMYSLTGFAKTKHVAFETEVEEIIRWFEFLSESFPVTYVIHAGHDRRLSRYVLSRIRSDLLFLVETDLLSVLARPFSNIVVIPRVYHQINDAMFTHLDISSSIPMRGATRCHEWLQNWKPHLGIADYRVLVEAHTHHSGLLNLPAVQLVESGCFQCIPEWVFNKLPRQAWTWGWVTLQQMDGVTDLNATKLTVYREY